MLRTLVLLAVFCLFTVTPTYAADFNVGDRIALKATHPNGVPLHERSENSFHGDRAADGAKATVVETAHSANWLRINIDNGPTRWIVKKYAVADSAPPPQQDTEALVWQSREACQQAVAVGARMAQTSPATLRLVTWNLRWFPDGEMTPNDRNATEPQDMAWLTCVMSWMNADIIALQEIRQKQSANDNLTTLADGIEATLGGDWRVSMQGCGANGSQRVGYLWNAGRVTLSNMQSLWQFNAKADSANDDACESRRRPGQYARVTTTGGADFHLISVHLKSGTGSTDRDSRDTSLSRLPQTVANFFSSDKDIIVIGDFNTMGRGDHATADAEIAALTSTVSGQTPAWKHLTVEPRCTEYYQGEGGWLDHVIATQDMAELPATTARVTGYCAIANCDRLTPGSMPAAYRSLSDHCPVVVEINNSDQD